jgi:hypothetical protein
MILFQNVVQVLHRSVSTAVGPDRAAAATDGIANWWPSQSRKICLQQVGGRRGAAKVGHKWGNFGLCWCGW